MRKLGLVLGLSAALLVQHAFAANTAGAAKNRPCVAIAKACLVAGYSRTDVKGKHFWVDCMKPVVLGQTVQGVTVDPEVVKVCRDDKIKELKEELNQLQSVK